MTTSSVTRIDHDLQTAVEEELDWAPEVDAASIGVAVNSGAVILTGEVRDHSECVAAQQAALRVRGVSAVVDDLKVHPHVSWPASEIEIATAVANALRWASNVPETVQAEIKDHKVTLVGTVHWDFERLAARDAVHYLRGVYAVDNQITLSARPSAIDTGARIKDAIRRNAQLDANHISVDVDGNTVTLSGQVRSWSEKEQAAAASWASPHVTDVKNDLEVRAL
ncbi:transporter [Arthrobacter livingstonensis]|uniref:Transporter n=1 Tax=Arthrobacter livingstonensis TaxID=670078 RepID=A0A2V5LDB7_9MICC|nr:BON domain-containing protein [Arthrobacter livingstonensis]PYI64280.1 transporter [Arthrobacter livingstonensis]